MKRITTLLSCALLALFIACNKDNKETPTQQDKMDYEIVGFDTSYYMYSTAGSGGEIEFPVVIRHISGTKEPVTLSSSNVPAGCKVRYLSVTGSIINTVTPDDTIVFDLLIDSTIKAGTYYPHFIAVSASGLKKEDSIRYIVH